MTRDQAVYTESDVAEIRTRDNSIAAHRYTIRYLLSRLADLGEEVDAESLRYGGAVALSGWGESRKKVVQVAKKGSF